MTPLPTRPTVVQASRTSTLPPRPRPRIRPVAVEDIRADTPLPKPLPKPMSCDDLHTDVVIPRDRARALRLSPALWEIIETMRADGQSNSDLLRGVLMEAGHSLYADATDWAIQCRLEIPRLNAEYEFQAAGQRARRVERAVGDAVHPRAQARRTMATVGLSAAWDALLRLDGMGDDVIADADPWGATQPRTSRLTVPTTITRTARESVRRTTHLTRREDALIAHVCTALATTTDALIEWRVNGVVPLRDERPVGTRLAMAQQAVALALRGGIPALASECEVCGSVTPL